MFKCENPAVTYVAPKTPTEYATRKDWLTWYRLNWAPADHSVLERLMSSFEAEICSPRLCPERLNQPDVSITFDKLKGQMVVRAVDTPVQRKAVDYALPMDWLNWYREHWAPANPIVLERLIKDFEKERVLLCPERLDDVESPLAFLAKRGK